MTEDQLKILRLETRIFVRDEALKRLVAVVRALPNGEQSIQAWSSRVQQMGKGLTLEFASAAMSDMLAAEYQEALKEMFDALA